MSIRGGGPWYFWWPTLLRIMEVTPYESNTYILHPSLPSQMLASTPPVMAVVHWGSHVHCITNTKFTDTFLSAEELNSCLERGLGSQYLWSR